jgi:UDP-glucose 4-epimerase
MTRETWLITGGAGYIGTHIADLFIADGKDVVLLDSLYQGLESRVAYLRKKHNTDVPLEVVDIRDYTAVENILENNNFAGIVHTAALKAVGESVEKPDEYKEVNFTATAELLKLAQKYGVKKFLFSSTAAVYGSPDTMEPCKENGPLAPISPYGSTKLDAESKVTEFINTPGNSGTSLRFFNVVGTAAPELMDNSVENLVPIVINKLKAGQAPVIYGTDYPTPDGTCVRDYVDVRDIAGAHLAAANFEGALPLAMNVGTGVGGSVREVIRLVCEAAGHVDVAAVEKELRAGDPAFLCADVALINHAIGFRAKYNLQESSESLF